jgi:hypothetical protein
LQGEARSFVVAGFVISTDITKPMHVNLLTVCQIRCEKAWRKIACVAKGCFLNREWTRIRKNHRIQFDGQPNLGEMSCCADLKTVRALTRFTVFIRVYSRPFAVQTRFDKDASPSDDSSSLFNSIVKLKMVSINE